MFLFKTKLTTIIGVTFAVALSLGTVAPAEAAPPPGMRWSDHAGLNGPRSQPTRVVPAYSTPRFSRYSPVTMMPAVMTPAPGPVSVRGPDGVVRTYPARSSPPVVTYPCR